MREPANFQEFRKLMTSLRDGTLESVNPDEAEALANKYNALNCGMRMDAVIVACAAMIAGMVRHYGGGRDAEMIPVTILALVQEMLKADGQVRVDMVDGDDHVRSH